MKVLAQPVWQRNGRAAGHGTTGGTGGSARQQGYAPAMGGRILIVDALATNRIVLRARLGAGKHVMLQATSGSEALDCARREGPGLVVIAPTLPDMTGAELARRLRADPPTARLPMLLLHEGRDPAQRIAALRAGLAAGADDVVARDCGEAAFLARIRRLLRADRRERELDGQAAIGLQLGLAEAPAEFARPPRLGLIAPDGVSALAGRLTLVRAGLGAVVEPLSPQSALSIAGQPGAPGHFLIVGTPGQEGGGLPLVADLRARLGGDGAGIAVALAEPEGEMGALALDLGADVVIGLPLEPDEVAVRLAQMEARRRRIDRMRRAIEDGLAMAATDPLTGLWNRRYALAHLERIAARALEAGTGFAVMLLDLDRFKRINDAHGHAAGDMVLTAVAARMQAALRPSDLLARIGGEEFVVVLPDPGPGVAQALAERLCRAVSGAPVMVPGLAPGLVVTLSVGLAMVSTRPAAPALPEGRRPADQPGTTAAALARLALERADAALYAAKDEGRNQVVATAASAA